MSRIKSIEPREILDSRGEPTIEVALATSEGTFFASVPSGASKGEYEAVAKPVPEVIKNLKEIIEPALIGKDGSEQKEIDELLSELDATKNKSWLGANTILAVSMACCRAGAGAAKLPLWQYIFQLFEGTSTPLNPPSPQGGGKGGWDMFHRLPRPCFNIIEGGKHADNDLALQEFMIVPQFSSFSQNLQVGKKIYQNLKNVLKKRFGQAGVKLGDEAGFAPPLKKTKQALDLLMKALTYFRRSPEICYLGLDCAASQFYKGNKGDRGNKGDKGNKGNKGNKGDGCYFLEGKCFSQEELLDFYQDLLKDYPIIFLEDPFAQDDWPAWQKISSKFKVHPVKLPLAGFNGVKNSNLLLVGDDLTVTNPEGIKLAKEKNACNGVVIKPNQIGTVSETLEAVKLAKGYGWKIIVSHRSGETKDDFIADLAVGVGADFIKSGAPSRPERLSKYNRLLKIEQELKTSLRGVRF